MRKKRSDLSQYSRTARRMRIRRCKESIEDREERLAASRERRALTRAVPEQIVCVQYNHFTPDQFESNRADGLVKLKPNAVPTIFYQFELQAVRKVHAEKKKVLRRRKHCSVAGCKSKYVSRKNNVVTFPLPSDKRLRKKWLRKIPTDLSTLKKPVICIKHFKEKYIIRTKQFIIDGEVHTIERSCPVLKPDAVPSIFSNRPKKRRRTPGRGAAGGNEEVMNVLDLAKNSLQGSKKRLSSHGQRSQHTEALQLDMTQNQIVSGSIANMLEVDFYPHMCSVDVKQDPENYETEEPNSCANEEFAEDPLITTGCSVIIKEEPDSELSVDIVENSVLEEPFQTSICTDNIQEEPESTLEAAGVERNVNKFSEVFVPEWCPPHIKQEET